MFKEIGPLAQAPTLENEEFKAFQENQNQQLLALVKAERFDEVEHHWKASFHNISAGLREILNQDDVIQYSRYHDRLAYQSIVALLLPDVLQRTSPGYAKAVRSFSKRAEGWLLEALTGLPDVFVKAKQTEASLFSQRLRRYTSLNHLASAARAVLTKETHVKAMTEDYEKIDFDGVKEQLLWVCEGCDANAITRFEAEFRTMQATSFSVEAWASWLQKVVMAVLSPHCGTGNLATQAGEFQLKWAMLSSLVIRDLTLRSANSFGMFHLMRLLCDEYVFFLLERTIMAGAAQGLQHAADGGVELQVLQYNCYSYKSHVSSTISFICLLLVGTKLLCSNGVPIKRS
eukprot:m.46663 g.46663  ORF g.46663 m.46663 type:complete len:345 (-) comp13167_c0_seq1:122-1156(-)